VLKDPQTDFTFYLYTKESAVMKLHLEQVIKEAMQEWIKTQGKYFIALVLENF
jgi:hypothetical protein